MTSQFLFYVDFSKFYGGLRYYDGESPQYINQPRDINLMLDHLHKSLRIKRQSIVSFHSLSSKVSISFTRPRFQTL